MKSINRSPRTQHKLGYTMIELMVVLVLMSLIFGGVMLKLGGPLANAKMEFSKSSLVNFDRRVRELSRRRKKAHTLQVDIDRGHFALREDQSDGNSLMRLQLPEGVQLTALRVDGVWRETGIVEQSVRATGEMASYCVAFSSSKSASKTRWLFFVGGSGQVIEYENEASLPSAEIVAKSIGPDAY
ncbi:type II secretion system protein [Planctomycetota bacterium]